MYVTRPLSLYSKSPNSLTELPAGPNSGIIVIEDDEAKKQSRCCFGLFKTSRLFGLPIPQNKMVKVRYSFRLVYIQQTYSDDVYFIPAVGQPLSSNRYYVLRANGKNKGKCCTCSKEEGISTACLCTTADDMDPIQFDHGNIYQQVEIKCHRNKYYAKSIASDGIPPRFLRRKNWRGITSDPCNFSLSEALGMNTSLWEEMPDLNVPICTKYSRPTVVGKWYSPYIFVTEGEQMVREQMRKSMFYEATLEKLWEEIYACENYDGGEKNVKVSVNVVREVALLNGKDETKEEFDGEKGLIWFRPVNSVVASIGLSLVIWERMRWEEKRQGYIGGEKNVEKIEREEIYQGDDHEWMKFGCYVLVERFVFRRRNGSVALTYEFKHTDTVKVKWE